MKKRTASWSISRLNDFELCPAKYKYKHISKLPEPKSPAMQRGIDIHGIAERYLNGRIARLPKELKKFADEMRAIKKMGATSEQTWAFDRGWSPVQFDDVFRDWNNLWLLVKTDAHYVDSANVLVVIDFKTGQVKDASDQARLYALGGMNRFPEVGYVNVELWYLDHGHTSKTLFPRKEKQALAKEFAARARKIENEKNFRPRENWSCKFCAFSKRKSGPCRY